MHTYLLSTCTRLRCPKQIEHSDSQYFAHIHMHVQTAANKRDRSYNIVHNTQYTAPSIDRLLIQVLGLVFNECLLTESDHMTFFGFLEKSS